MVAAGGTIVIIVGGEVIVATGTAACADGNCTNEVQGAANAVQQVANAVSADGDPTNEVRQVLTLSQHAIERMAQRGITLDQINLAVSQGESFAYYHEGVWKTGFYDSATRLFVGSVENTVTTVFYTTANYIERLKAVQP